MWESFKTHERGRQADSSSSGNEGQGNGRRDPCFVSSHLVLPQLEMTWERCVHQWEGYIHLSPTALGPQGVVEHGPEVSSVSGKGF